ncbi:unnamed protein product [Clonostachys chloroleuca]|uniref:ZZ-type domain-containing protein n=1 Tax=Clonostachys chloroleuca TaxID=1926264 RepID=A0AA35MAF4_9HYPO|nr:unnamed protein product [Clonostachys chloroleuca]
MASHEAENNMKLMPWGPSYVDQAQVVRNRQAHQPLPNGEEVPNFDIARNKERGFLHPTIDSGKQIRVLKILPEATITNLVCEFDIVDFNGASANSYFALSYTWGSAAGGDDVHDILILDGSEQPVPFCVRQNVWEFLTSDIVRSKLSARPIYIDAICINQLDNDEKGHQIQLMQSVYSQALEVIIWLGSSTVSAKDDLNLRSLQEHGDWVWTEKGAMTAGAGIGGNGDSSTDKQKLAVEFISSQPYWSRTWIIQEIMLASDISIIVGNYIFPWSQVAKLGPQSIQSSLWHKDSHGLPLMNMTFVEGQLRFGQRSAMFGLLERKTKWDSQFALNTEKEKGKTYFVPCYVAFGTFAEHACSDPRDKFYAMLGVVEEDIRKDTVPDYHFEVPEVYEVALAAGFRSIKAHLRDSLKMRLEAFGILAAHLHEAFGLKEVDICDIRAAVLAKPSMHADIQSDLTEARLLEDEIGLKYRHAQACRSNHAPKSCEPHCLLTGLIEAPDSSSSSILADKESEKSQAPVSNLSLAIHIRGTASGGGPLDYQGFEYGQWSGRSSLRSIQNLGMRPEVPTETSDQTRYKQCLFYTDRERGDGDMYWMVGSPHGSYTAPIHICRKTDSSDGWTVSYEDAIPKPHHATCDSCEKPIVAVRYRCLQCLDFDICSPCMKEAEQSKDEHVDQHDFEIIYHPASSISHTTNPLRYLALNFRRVPYRMHPGVFGSYLHDPDPDSAVKNCLACGIMFPWSPREGIWPPYWVANLNIMTWTPADKGVPHIRCMGLRLRDSDPTDRPPTPMPGGYRFFGQIQLCAIRQQLAQWASSFSPPVELTPDVNLTELVDRRRKEREARGDESVRGGGEIVLLLAFPPMPRADGVENDDIVEEDGVWALSLPRSRRPSEDENDVPTAPGMHFWTAADFDEATIAKMKAQAGRQLKLLPTKADAPMAERQWVTFRW